eukprot:gene1138-1242_t
MIEEIEEQIMNEDKALSGGAIVILDKLHAALIDVNSQLQELTSLLNEFEDEAEKFSVMKHCLPADNSNGAEESKAGKEEEKLLNLNVGGNKISISYDAILGAGRQCGLLGVLLHPRWRSFMLRDRDGNIFLDLDAECLQPILDSLQINQLDPKPSFLDHLVLPSLPAAQEGFWVLRDFFRLGVSPCCKVFSAFTAGNIMTMSQASELCHHIEKKYPNTTIKLLSEVDSIGKISSVTSKGNTKHLFVCGGSTAWVGFVAFNAWNGPGSGYSVQANWVLWDGSDSSFKSFDGAVVMASYFDCFSYNSNNFSLGIGYNSSNGGYNSSTYPIAKWAIYEICPNNQTAAQDERSLNHNEYSTNDYFEFDPVLKMFQSVDLNISDSPVSASCDSNGDLKSAESLPKIDIREDILHCVSGLNGLSSLAKVIDQMQEAMAINRAKVLDEVQFMENYVRTVYGFPAVPKPIDDEMPLEEPSPSAGVDISQIADVLKRLEKLLPAIYSQNRANLSPTTVAKVQPRADISSIHGDTESLVAYFNVAGSQICANKMALLLAFPYSQLATRMWSRWDEQADTLDQEGNRIYNLPYGVFKTIINAARTSTLNHSPPKVRVNPTQVQQVNAVIKYLMISDLPIETIN